MECFVRSGGNQFGQRARDERGPSGKLDPFWLDPKCQLKAGLNGCFIFSRQPDDKSNGTVDPVLLQQISTLDQIFKCCIFPHDIVQDPLIA